MRLKVLIACEESQEVCKAFRRIGHEAFSCDLQESSGGFPQWHLQGDAIEFTYQRYWDLLIAHPPCTRLTNAVSWYIKKYNLYNEVKEAAEFFNLFINAPVKYICVENPVQNKEAKKYIRKQDQIIQPYNFGNNASKQTALWLKNLPKLKNTVYYEPRLIDGKKRWGNQTDSGQNKLGPSKNRAKLRSKTYSGIAEAMAIQWSEFILNDQNNSNIYIQQKLF